MARPNRPKLHAGSAPTRRPWVRCFATLASETVGRRSYGRQSRRRRTGPPTADEPRFGGAGRPRPDQASPSRAAAVWTLFGHDTAALVRLGMPRPGLARTWAGPSWPLYSTSNFAAACDGLAWSGNRAGPPHKRGSRKQWPCPKGRGRLWHQPRWLAHRRPASARPQCGARPDRLWQARFIRRAFRPRWSNHCRLDTD
jgi:hypothetical protein